LHGLKLRAPGRQSGGRDQGAVSRRARGAGSIGRWPLRGEAWWCTGLREIEARAPCRPWWGRTAAPNVGAVARTVGSSRP